MGCDMLYLECRAGISGDMFVAALLDLGADEEVVRRALDSLPLRGFRTVISRVSKAGLDACDFAVILDEEYENHDHDMTYLYGADSHAAVRERSDGDHRHTEEHGHGHGHTAHSHEVPHAHRGMAEIMDILHAAVLTERARELAIRIFTILGEAEAAAHGTTLEQVHFHEVGAVDSIVDVVAAAVCLDNLEIDAVVVPVLYEGVGHIRCQHGMMPVPVPAVTHIVSRHRLRLHIMPHVGEYVTPTGAAIAAAICTHTSLPDEFELRKIGIGAGKRTQEVPGLLRGLLIRPMAQQRTETDRICKLETNLDDCTGEALGYAMEQLLEAGARDVYCTPVYAKKNRPAHLLTVLCDVPLVPVMEEILFAETTTIGIRRTTMKRSVLSRRIRTVNTSLGCVRVKECAVPVRRGTEGTAGRITRCYPEHDSIDELCKRTGRAYQDVYRCVMKELPAM